MKIIIGADLVPTSSNCDLFKSGDIDQIFGKKIVEILKSADYSVFNLEVPLYNGDTPINKCGPVLSAETSTICGIKALNPYLLSIANNHILDHGEDGLISTINTLEENDINYIGAGKDLESAKKPFIIDNGEVKVGIYSCAEHEFSIASEKSSGANPFDALYSLDDIQVLKSKVDYVIVLFHGGKELYRYPTPMQQKRCRRMIEKGADVVICQHSHCVGCEEIYNNGTIVYGQGNFLFDISNCDEFKTGLLTEINIDKTGVTVSYIPIIKKNNLVRLDENSLVISHFKKRSEEITHDGVVNKKFDEIANNDLFWLLQSCIGKRGRRFLFRAINKLFKHKYIFRLFSKNDYYSLINRIDCETHRELLLTGLKNKK